MSTVPDRLATDPGWLLNRINHLRADMLGAALRLVGRTAREHAVLLATSELSRPVSQQAISQALWLDQVSVGSVLERLEEADLVERKRDPTDGRRKLVTLTARGAEALVAAEIAVAEVTNRLLDGLSSSEREQLTELLAELARHRNIL